jgi:inhibitor of KinA sporulation pathway (predicted exonuclease)
VWDEYKQKEFDLRALLFVTINDWSALSNFSGQTNKRYNACTHYFGDLEAVYLKKCQKVVYFGYRRFLAKNHQLRKKGKHFKGTVEHRSKPGNRDGAEVFKMVKDWKVVFGKGQGSVLIPKDASERAPM